MTTDALSPARPGRASIDRWVIRIAGVFVLGSVALSQLHDPRWLWFTAFVGANLFQSSFTGFCPLAMILRKLGIRPGLAFCEPAGGR
jgi:Inner membrane protein YgaP-like, transmembrane domain